MYFCVSHHFPRTIFKSVENIIYSNTAGAVTVQNSSDVEVKGMASTANGDNKIGKLVADVL